MQPIHPRTHTAHLVVCTYVLMGPHLTSPAVCCATEADPAKPQLLSCPPGYGYVQSLTGTPYVNYPNYKGGAMCLPCGSGFYSPGGRSRCLSCASGASNAGFITPQGASSAAQCVCAAGFGGPGCKICPPGNFRSVCTVCAAAEYSVSCECRCRPDLSRS
jgi:hypothetical protein